MLPTRTFTVCEPTIKPFAPVSAAPLLFFLLLSYVTSVILWGMTLSARNRLEGKVVELQFGGVMAHVVVRVGKNLIESVITKRSADEMKLKVGDKVSAVIKSTEVMLDKK
jgi:molybdopterin-binding protein